MTELSPPRPPEIDGAPTPDPSDWRERVRAVATGVVNWAHTPIRRFSLFVVFGLTAFIGYSGMSSTYETWYTGIAGTALKLSMLVVGIIGVTALMSRRLFGAPLPTERSQLLAGAQDGYRRSESWETSSSAEEALAGLRTLVEWPIPNWPDTELRGYDYDRALWVRAKHPFHPRFSGRDDDAPMWLHPTVFLFVDENEEGDGGSRITVFWDPSDLATNLDEIREHERLSQDLIKAARAATHG